MATVLTIDHNLDDLRSDGHYIVPASEGVYYLRVESGKTPDNVGFVIQTRINVLTGEESKRVHTPHGSWTKWAATLTDLQDYATKEYAQRVSGGGNGSALEDANDKVSGLMSAADYKKLRDIEEGAKAHMLPQQILDALKEVHGKDSGLDADKIQGHSPSDFAAHDHNHSQYVTAQVFSKAISEMLPKEAMRPENLVKLLTEFANNIDISKFAGADKFVRRDEFTRERIRDMLGEIDATSLQGHKPGDFASRDHGHGSEYQPRNRRLLSADTPAVLEKGMRHKGKNHGTLKADYKLTVNPSDGLFQSVTNAGHFTIMAPTATEDYEVNLLVTNAANAGPVDFEGFSNDVEHLASWPGAVYRVKIVKHGNRCDAEVKVLRTGER